MFIIINNLIVSLYQSSFLNQIVFLDFFSDTRGTWESFLFNYKVMIIRRFYIYKSDSVHYHYHLKYIIAIFCVFHL